MFRPTGVFWIRSPVRLRGVEQEGLTWVGLDGGQGAVRQVLEHLDLGEGQVAGEEGHDLDVDLVRGADGQGHGHQPRALTTHSPAAAAVSH